ncbi:MAG: hypothetical protein RJA13_2385 [Bacteroidota bacterium]
MKITLIFIFITLFSFGQKLVVLPSEIKKVTVFFQGAQVEHFKSVELDPSSVQVKAKGELTILSVRTRKNYEDLKISNAEISVLNAKRKKLEETDILLRDEYEILSLDKNLLMTNRDLKGNEQGLKIAELKEAYTFMHQKLTEITARQSAIYDALEKLNKEMNQLEQEIISQRSKPVINFTEIIVEIDVEKATKGEFYFSYITPNASWKPYYDMRSDGIGKPVRLEAKALVNQTSGISWDAVDLVLSTNDPYDNSKEPQLNPWYLNYQNYPPQKQIYTRQIPQNDYSGEKLRGEVIDASTGEPLPFAKISFPSNPNVGAVTDFDGKFELIVPRGEKFVVASYVGYAPRQLAITAPYLKFFIESEAIELEEVMISSNASVTRQDMSRLPARSVEGLFSRKKSKTDYKADSYSAPNKGNADKLYFSAPTASSIAVQKDLRMEYAIQSKFTIPSDGLDCRVQIANYELPASYEYHSVPKIDPSVYLAAQISGWEKLNLLNGLGKIKFIEWRIQPIF